MVKQKKRTHITQSRKNCAINCAINGVRLIWKQKIWLAIFDFLWSLTNQNAWFVSSFCAELTLFCTVFKRNCPALNQSEWRKFFMYIIMYETISSNLSPLEKRMTGLPSTTHWKQQILSCTQLYNGQLWFFLKNLVHNNSFIFNNLQERSILNRKIRRRTYVNEEESWFGVWVAVRINTPCTNTAYQY